MDEEKRKVGPDLRHVGAKLSKEFVADWIMDPTAFRPSTAIAAGHPGGRSAGADGGGGDHRIPVPQCVADGGVCRRSQRG